jgi:hypothetical protein
LGDQSSYAGRDIPAQKLAPGQQLIELKLRNFWYWHKADMSNARSDVSCRGKTDMLLLAAYFRF